MPGEWAAAQDGSAQNIRPGGEWAVVLVEIPETLSALQAAHQNDRPIIPVIPKVRDEQAEAQDAEQQQRERYGAYSKL